MPDPFDLAAVDSAITGTEFSGYVLHSPSVTSTSDLAHAAAQTGARHGVWIADQQTAGRGRAGHTWHSAPGDGLYMTALISPPIPMQSALQLSLRVAIAVESAIASTYGFRIPAEIDIRWPNDLLLNGRKVGGILIDTASNPATLTEPATLRHAILGIGINVNHTTFPPELEAIATSIRRELDVSAYPEASASRHPKAASRYPKASALGLSDPAKDVGFSPWGVASPAASLPREPLAAAILIALDVEIRRLATDNRQLTTDNCSLCSTWITGKRVRVEARDGDPGYTGVTAGLNPSGFLLVAGDDGQIHTVLTGGLREP
jgi:BirA family biotin operon repressor/biotin-[acetyl-CoA-carboxylase] ligase